MIVHPSVIARLERLRDMNERIVESRRAFAGGRPENGYDLMCECPSESCERMVHVGPEVWQAATGQPERYLVAHDPVAPLVSVELGDGWQLARLHPDARRAR